MLLAVSLALVALTSASYNDNLARTKIFPMSAAAYSTKPADCIANTYTNGTLKRQLNVFCDATMIDKCSAFTAVSHADQAIIIAFRGTDRNMQLVAEADETLFKNHTPWVAGGKVSKYFDDGFTRLWNQGIKSDLSTLLNQNGAYNVWVTGHSLGGAMAILAASYIVENKLVDNKKLTLVTFGEPRVGDKDFATAVDKQLKSCYRVTHHKDMVPHLPFKNEEGYRQHEQEIYYKNDMKVGDSYKSCIGDEDVLCSDGNIVDFSIKDHLHYFNVDVSAYGIAGCKS